VEGESLAAGLVEDNFWSKRDACALVERGRFAEGSWKTEVRDLRGGEGGDKGGDECSFFNSVRRRMRSSCWKFKGEDGIHWVRGSGIREKRNKKKLHYLSNKKSAKLYAKGEANGPKGRNGVDQIFRWGTKGSRRGSDGMPMLHKGGGEAGPSVQAQVQGEPISLVTWRGACKKGESKERVLEGGDSSIQRRRDYRARKRGPRSHGGRSV